MYKEASAWHAQGEQLMNALLEDDREKTASTAALGLALGPVSGAVGNYYGEREARRKLREKGYSPSQIAAASSGTRGRGGAAMSGLGYHLGGNLIGMVGGSAAFGGLAGLGYGGYRNYTLKQRRMLAKARELRGRDMEDGYIPRARKRR